MDFVLALFPAGSGLGQSVITTVWVGTAVVCLLNLRFGFPLTGLVVPGYIVPLLIISPTSAVVIIIEAIVVYGFMRMSASYLMERFGYSEMFGRDRFFAIILISILVRVCMDTLFWPIIAEQLSQWDITFDYASQLYSLGLIIIALTANVMWNGGFKYGLKVTFIQLFITYMLVRFILMPFTNFSIANLGIMYEAVAASIIAAPKAYIILVITAFLASRANLKYGWEFNGIMLPALLALQLTQPSKILTSFIETAVILAVGTSLINYTRLRHAHIEGARLLMLFFTIGFIFKLILNYIVVWFFPTVKVTDTFAFGYMLATLLALKIYQKNALGLVLRATFQTSVIGGSLAIIVGFLVMLVPSLLIKQSISPTAENLQVITLNQQVSQYKSYLYTTRSNKVTVSSYKASQAVSDFKYAVYQLNQAIDNKQKLGHLNALFNSIGFKLVADENYVYLIDIVEDQQRGLFVINKTPQTNLIITVPYPITEGLASDSAALIFQHLKSKALVFGATRTPQVTLAKENQQSVFYQAFINALEINELLQVRESNRYTAALLKSSPDDVKSQYWIFNRLPESISQREIHEFLGSEATYFGKAAKSSLPSTDFTGSMLEVFLDGDNYTNILAYIYRENYRFSNLKLNTINESMAQIVDDFTAYISSKGSLNYQPLTHSQVALWEFEVLTPLYKLIEQIGNTSINDDVLNHLKQINGTAELLNYQLQLIQNNNGRYILLSPLQNNDAQALGQGLYAFSLSKHEAISLSVPRPIFEGNTLSFASELFTNSNAANLLIAGAHPYAHPEANVLAANNVSSLFNVVHQSYSRFKAQQPSLNIQIRSHSAPSWIRPNAIAFSNTQVRDIVTPLMEKLARDLSNLGVSYQVVEGQKATRGLEIGSSPQYGYQQFNANSELATLWIASDFKEQFSIDQNSLLMRLLAISNKPTVTTINLATLSPSNWAALTVKDKQIIQQKINNYTADKQTAVLKTICFELNECALQTIKLEQLNKFALMIKKQNNLIAIYNPASNQLIDMDVFNNMMVGGINVSN
ncbi:poly-gamma-glutamate biosynthesis protein PgsC/CapC [Pseudoalteromonas gelatinilytica]|uniref:Capsule biosynthesis CapC n=1 Tax=Pseudoalteromonas gelatinilytica TaxID=1703256 RepID=A0A3A3EHI5_9GAMM|nr:poly-gamma-glutamate biosynthesis protein PgsC/CapC [Pseudoalteromonas profundi]RJF34440.1 hypothetical protein D4741_13715 [Pseudoalteromonas profundi]